MNPLAWQNVHPLMPATSLSLSSRTPRHASGKLFLFSNESGFCGTHWIRHLDPGASFSGYRTYRIWDCEGASVGSSANRWSFHGDPWVNLTMAPLGSTVRREARASATSERAGSQARWK